MSVVHGQENSGQPFDRAPNGLRAYYLDGSIEEVDNQTDNQFKNKWNSLDHPNLVSVVLFQKQRFGQHDPKDNTSKWRNYRFLIHTNEEPEDATWYWMADDTLLPAIGFSSDIPPGAHAYPMILRDPALIEDQQMAAFLDRSWT